MFDKSTLFFTIVYRSPLPVIFGKHIQDFVDNFTTYWKNNRKHRQFNEVRKAALPVEVNNTVGPFIIV